MAYTLDQYAEMWQRIAAGGDISDDFPLTITEIKAWILEVYSAAVCAYLRSKKANDEITGVEDSWLKKYSCLPVTEKCECGVSVWYVDLQEPVLALPNDMGLVYVSVCGGQELFKTKMVIANRVNLLEAANFGAPMYHFEGQIRVYFTRLVKKATIWVIAQPSSNEIFNIPPDVASVEYIQNKVIQKIQMFLAAPKDVINDSAYLPTP